MASFELYPLSHSTVPMLENYFGAKLQHVPIVPSGQIGMCYWNADATAQLTGGTVKHGWQIFLWPDKFVMAVHHALVQGADGKLLDPTPHPFPAMQGTVSSFVLDETIVPGRAYPAFIENLFWPVDHSASVATYISLQKRITAIDRDVMKVIEKLGVPFAPGHPTAIPQTSKILELLTARHELNLQLTAAAQVLMSA